MKQEFIQAVDNGNVGKARLALTNELLLDPRGKTFTEMLTYAKDKLPNLFVENKEANYSVPPKDSWDEDFLFVVKNDLDSNFSIEKLAFYQAVIEVVGKSKAQELDEKERKPVVVKPEAATISNSKELQKVKTSSVTVTTGGAILTIVGICAGKTLLTILGGAVLIGGVLLILNDTRK